MARGRRRLKKGEKETVDTTEKLKNATAVFEKKDETVDTTEKLKNAFEKKDKTVGTTAKLKNAPAVFDTEDETVDTTDELKNATPVFEKKDETVVTNEKLKNADRQRMPAGSAPRPADGEGNPVRDADCDSEMSFTFSSEMDDELYDPLKIYLSDGRLIFAVTNIDYQM